MWLYRLNHFADASSWILFVQVFRIKPPMCITVEDADYTVAVLHQALANSRPWYCPNNTFSRRFKIDRSNACMAKGKRYFQNIQLIFIVIANCKTYTRCMRVIIYDVMPVSRDHGQINCTIWSEVVSHYLPHSPGLPSKRATRWQRFMIVYRP